MQKKLNPCPSSCTKINLKYIRDLNVRPGSLKLLVVNVEKRFRILEWQEFCRSKPQNAGNKRLNRQVVLHPIKARERK